MRKIVGYDGIQGHGFETFYVGIRKSPNKHANDW